MQRLAVLFAISIPIVAYPFTQATLDREDVRACASRIESLAVNRERAAFLMLKNDGTFGCKVWAEPSEYRRASWNRAIPDGTVAVIHTHPADSPDPSDHDFNEAKRLDAPVIVVCRGKLTMALPGKNSARERSVSNVYTSDPDEASTVSQSHPRQSSSLSDEGPRAHP